MKMSNNHLEKQEDSIIESLEEFVKNTWMILLGLFAIFGSGYGAFKGLNIFILENEIGRNILIIAYILLLALLWCIGCKLWKQRARLKKT
ncbi:MAG: hypothetical protein KAT65_20190 [Methanophagales archaeon]|nr:hypothetical protein [Methanophagales archaeon]